MGHASEYHVHLGDCACATRKYRSKEKYVLAQHFRHTITTQATPLAKGFTFGFEASPPASSLMHHFVAEQFPTNFSLTPIGLYRDKCPLIYRHRCESSEPRHNLRNSHLQNLFNNAHLTLGSVSVSSWFLSQNISQLHKIKQTTHKQIYTCKYRHKKRKGGSKREKARCCRPICLLGLSALDGRHKC